MRNGSHSGKRSAADHSAVLITGGAGFIGSNLAHRLLSQGERVILYDNLARPGVEKNVAWLREQFGEAVTLERADIRDAERLSAAVGRATSIFHFAAQVAVTTSLERPLEDFSINAQGTLNLLEAIRQQAHRPPLIFTSTNKVYGELANVPLSEAGERYEPANDDQRARGIDERQALDFYSPYGCSKGTADQYVLDFARNFGLPALVFRMSCIYGPRQFGTEDQGWVAHFLIRALAGRSITLYGDGRQVRDLLFVEDLVGAFLLARSRIDELKGEAFNIGGGAENATSLLELIDLIGAFEGSRPKLKIGPWRAGDQKYYVSDTSKFARACGWKQTRNIPEGLRSLRDWLLEAGIVPKPVEPLAHQA